MLEVYVIYDHPKDYPAHFVVRRWVGETPDMEALLCETIQQAWQQIPPGFVKLPRNLSDDPVIFETWI